MDTSLHVGDHEDVGQFRHEHNSDRDVDLCRGAGWRILQRGSQIIGGFSFSRFQ
jgi:hypothetical protein